jgi:subtilisin family serine protease
MQSQLLIIVALSMLSFTLSVGCGSQDDSDVEDGPVVETDASLPAQLEQKVQHYPNDVGLSEIEPALSWMERIQLTSALSDLSKQIHSSPIIAVLDSGLDTAHPAFESRVVDTSGLSTRCHGDQFGCNTSNYQYPDHKLGDGNIFPLGTDRSGVSCPGDGAVAQSQCQHGTHVAGIIAGYAPDSRIFGICPTCRILPIRIVNARGQITDDAIYAAFEYIAELRRAGLPIKIVNCSFGKYLSAERVNKAIARMTTNADDLLIVAAAGNENTEQEAFPAANSRVISVANVNSSDLRKDGRSNFGTAIDIAAPVGACSDWKNGYGIISSIPGYGAPGICANGTSMAAPMVSGVAGLLLSANPELTARELRQRLLTSADSKSLYLANPDYLLEHRGSTVTMLGSGVLNAKDALANRVSSSIPASQAKRVGPGCGTIGLQGRGGMSLIWFLAPVLFVFGMQLRTRKANPL